jgi:predicted transcriptional regulator
MAKRSRKNLARNIPLSLDKELLAEIDTVAGDRDENRSLIMRKAIQKGLPLVKLGGNADVITLDSEMSAEVDQLAKEANLKRNKILLESIRIGFHPFVSRTMSEKMSLADKKDPAEREMLLRGIEQSFNDYDNPILKENRRLVFERGEAVVLLKDILQHVPEAKRRHDALKHLTELRQLPDGAGGGPAWGRGLSTEEIQRQITNTLEPHEHPNAKAT